MTRRIGCGRANDQARSTRAQSRQVLTTPFVNAIAGALPREQVQHDAARIYRPASESWASNISRLR